MSDVFEDHPRELNLGKKPKKSIDAFPRTPGEHGMTLRDYFAGQVLASELSSQCPDVKWIAKFAYMVADAMLAERDVHV